MLYGVTFLISFLYIFTKAHQQLNVVNKRYREVIPTSLLMALCEVTIVTAVFKESVLVFIPIGLGGRSGVCFSNVYG